MFNLKRKNKLSLIIAGLVVCFLFVSSYFLVRAQEGGKNVYLMGEPSSSNSGEYQVEIKGVNEYGVQSEKSFSLKVNNYCGDGIKQHPNSEGRGGFYNDGYEDCDGNSAVAVSAATSGIDRQYGCATEVGANTPYPILDNNYCIFKSPLNGGGFCGDTYCQTEYETIENCARDCSADCEAKCDGRECGSDSCSGSCGPSCGEGQTCNSNGICELDCQPQCDGKECGDDSCLGRCQNKCTNSQMCDEDAYKCIDYCDKDEVCESDKGENCSTCSDCACENGYSCTDGECKQDCQPDCDGKVCGPDGCDGTCGSGCSGATVCVEGSCCPEVANIQVCADNEHTTYFNGEFVSSAANWRSVQKFNVNVREGKNVIAIKARDYQSRYGVSVTLNQEGCANMTTNDISAWKCTGVTPGGNWNKITYNDSSWPVAVKGYKGNKGGPNHNGGNSLPYYQIWASNALYEGTTVYCRYTFSPGSNINEDDDDDDNSNDSNNDGNSDDNNNDDGNDDDYVACTPDCANKECGSDGCNGQCPSKCVNNEVCNNITGKCEDNCRTDCANKECGNDGCGGECAVCARGYSCNDSFQCVRSVNPDKKVPDINW